jgi:NAD(P)H-hydrate epimerase
MREVDRAMVEDSHIELLQMMENAGRHLAHQLDILRDIGVPAIPAEMAGDARGGDLVLDGIVGYSLSGAPRGAAADLIRWANAQRTPVLALDVLSGLDGTTREAHGPCVQATATMTLALPELGLWDPRARRYVGELYLADISVPPQLYASLGLHVGVLFAEQDVIRLW